MPQARWFPVVPLVAMVVGVVAMTPRDADAALVEWTGPANGDRLWSTSSNWSGGLTPDDGDFLTFGDGSSGGRLENDLTNLALQRITFENSVDGYILEGNAAGVAEILAAEGSGTNEIAFNISGVGEAVVASGAHLILAGANSFSGDIDVAGVLEVRSNNALGSAAGGTNILPGGVLMIAGRDLGDEAIEVLAHPAGQCAIVNSLTSILRNVAVGGLNCIQNSGTLNFPDGIAALGGPFDLLLPGDGGTILVGGTGQASGAVRVSGKSTLVWNSSAPVALELAPFEQFAAGPSLLGAGTAATLEVRHGWLIPGNNGATGRFTVTGQLTLEDTSVVLHLNGSTAGSGYSQVQSGGPIVIGEDTTLDLVLEFEPHTGQTFRIIDNTGNGSITGTLSGLAEGATFMRGGRTFTITYKGGTGNDVEITRTAAPPGDPWPFKVRLPMLARN